MQGGLFFSPFPLSGKQTKEVRYEFETTPQQTQYRTGFHRTKKRLPCFDTPQR
jgi:hypothetical protein